MNIERYNKIFLDLFEAEESELNEAFNFGVHRIGILWHIWSLLLNWKMNLILCWIQKISHILADMRMGKRSFLSME